MARSAVTVMATPYNAATVITADAIDISNDHEIAINEVKDEKLTVLIQTLDTKAATFTFKAGIGQSAGQGDLVVSTAAAGLRAVCLESARFKDANGDILIDIVSTAGATGNIYALNHA
jgi:hypothetical protein